MKKLKLIFILLLSFSLTGCLKVSLDLTLKNDDSGSIKYVVACQKEYCESMTEDSPMIEEDDFKGIKDVTTKDVTFKKNDLEYQGKEVSIPFKSLQEFNDIMTRINEDEESTEEETKTASQFISAKREGSKVTLTLPSNPDSYAEMGPTLSMIDYSLTIKIEGKVLKQNADKLEKNKPICRYIFI
jgi:superfamily I DNA and RNA helicase